MTGFRETWQTVKYAVVIAGLLVYAVMLVAWNYIVFVWRKGK